MVFMFSEMSIVDIVNGVWLVVKKTCDHSKKIFRVVRPDRINFWYGKISSSRDPRISLKFCIKSTDVVMAVMPYCICYGYFLFDWFLASLL